MFTIIMNQLKHIKKIPYAIASIEEKFDMILKVLKDHPDYDESSYWSIVYSLFSNTKLKVLVTNQLVRQKLKEYSDSKDVTLSYKADLSNIMISNYGHIIDVFSIIEEVFSDKYYELKEQMIKNQLSPSINY